MLVLLISAASAWACATLLRALTIHRLLRDEATAPRLAPTEQPEVGE